MRLGLLFFPTIVKLLRFCDAIVLSRSLLIKLFYFSSWRQRHILRMRPLREEFPRGDPVRGVRTVHVLLPVPAVEVAGGPAHHPAHLQDVPGPGQGRVWRGLRVSGNDTSFSLCFRLLTSEGWQFWSFFFLGYLSS